MQSLATVIDYNSEQQLNKAQFEKFLNAFFPGMIQIYDAALETGVNLEPLPRLIRGLSLITRETGYGAIEIHCQAGQIVNFNYKIQDRVNVPNTDVLQKKP